MLEPGRTLAGYKIIEKIGEGGMGLVYKAQQLSLQRIVALKILPLELARDKTYVLKFEREAMSAARISHQNIVQVFDVGEEDGFHYITMEYVNGETLKDMIQSMKRIGWQGSIDILKQSLIGIDRAHKADIIHRDIKPDNIMITRLAEIKVADFGLAKATGDTSGLTQTGIVIGTPYYMSPEQIESKDLSGQTDLYSLGITLFHCLTGRPPFRGQTPMKTALLHLNNKLPDIRPLAPGLPEAYARIIEKMCAKSTKKRYKNAPEILADLLAFEQSIAQAPPAPASSSTAPAPITSKASSNEKKSSTTTHSMKRPSTAQPQPRAQPSAHSRVRPSQPSHTNHKKKSSLGLIRLVLFVALLACVWFFLPQETKDNLLSKTQPTALKNNSLGNQIDGFLQKASDAQRRGDYSSALIWLKAAYERQPNPELKTRIETLERRIKLSRNAGVFDFNLKEAQTALHRRDWHEAYKLFTHALEVKPKHIDALAGQAQALRHIEGCPTYMVRVDDSCVDLYEYPNRSGQQPLSNVTWLAAMTLCQKQDKRLCSVATWQSACRGPQQHTYPYGNMFNSKNCWVNPAANKAKASGTSPHCRSPHGIYDMSGNLMEWTSGSPTTQNTQDRFLAGGSWLSQKSEALTCTPTLFASTNIKRRDIGFRCCTSPKNAASITTASRPSSKPSVKI